MAVGMPQGCVGKIRYFYIYIALVVFFLSFFFFWGGGGGQNFEFRFGVGGFQKMYIFMLWSFFF